MLFATAEKNKKLLTGSINILKYPVIIAFFGYLAIRRIYPAPLFANIDSVDRKTADPIAAIGQAKLLKSGAGFIHSS